jgi:hypothetical protein
MKRPARVPAHLLTAGVIVLVGSFAPLSVCQSRAEQLGVTSLLDCTYRHEAVDTLTNLVVVLGKTTNPKSGITFDEEITSGEVVNWKHAVVNNRPLTIITTDASDKGCILREDWDNIQASVNNEK